MSQSLPTDGFRWLNNDEIQELFTKLKDTPEDGAKGYILEVDLEIPLDKYIYIYMFIHEQHTCIVLQSYNVYIMI